MAKYFESLIVPRSLKQTAEACRRVFLADRWKVMDDSGFGFFVKERFDPFAYLLYYPCKFAIFLRREGSRKTIVELHGSMFGITFLQTRRIRRMTAALRQRIEAECGV